MREEYYRRTYGISMVELEQILSAQDQRCAICRKHWTDCAAAKSSRYETIFLQHLYVDHDHETGKVRGLLCNNCNAAIAFLGEDLQRISFVADYLRIHKPGSA
jgi:hypothetical protein